MPRNLVEVIIQNEHGNGYHFEFSDRDDVESIFRDATLPLLRNIAVDMLIAMNRSLRRNGEINILSVKDICTITSTKD